jgi:hypothetical protein
MQKLHLEHYAYRFAERVLNSKLALKQEVEAILTSKAIEIATLSRPTFNKVLRDAFTKQGWQDQPHVTCICEEDDPAAKMDFLRIESA